jgi:hypothetical protein
MNEEPMSPEAGAPPVVSVQPVRQALTTIEDSRMRVFGGPSRDLYYREVLPYLEVVYIGARPFPTVESQERFVTARKRKPKVKGAEAAA